MTIPNIPNCTNFSLILSHDPDIPDVRNVGEPHEPWDELVGDDPLEDPGRRHQRRHLGPRPLGLFGRPLGSCGGFL